MNIKMKKKIHLFFTLLLSLFGFCSHAQKAAVPAKVAANENSLLWKISGKGLKQNSYLFGTIHAICPDDYFFTEKMDQAFKTCKQLVLEVNLNDAAQQMEMLSIMALTNGMTLRDFFPSPRDYDSFATRLMERKEMDAAAFMETKPFVLYSAIAMKSLSCETPDSYEMNLIKKSKDQRIEVIGLETFYQQMALFDEMPREEMVNLLWRSLDEGTEGESEFSAMVAAYRKQELKKLYQLLQESDEIKGHENELLFERNRQWMNKLPDLFKTKSSFVAVGAGHLPGEQGLIALLRKAGYTVEAIGN